jgi:hypothetical protein
MLQRLVRIERYVRIKKEPDGEWKYGSIYSYP